VSNIASSPTSPTNAATDITDDESESDVSGTVLSGSASVAGDVITSQLVSSLTAGQDYRIAYTFTLSGNTLGAYFILHCPL
jgi:hypothetical protein